MTDRTVTAITPDEGFSYTAPAGVAELGADVWPSSVTLLEDGVPLAGARDARLCDIRSKGRGRHALWHGHLYFSSSDNSDPRSNGRTYALRVARAPRSLPAKILARLARVRPVHVVWAAAYWGCFALVWAWGMLDVRRLRTRVAKLVRAAAPVNMQKRVATDAQIADDVAYALRIGESYLERINGLGRDLEGASVLEIGPGINFGSVLLTGCFGARPMVADRFLAPWDRAYHPRFYARFRDAVKERFPAADLSPIEAIVAQGSYDGVIERFACALEDLKGVPDAGIDVVFSNAVLEHVYDPRAATASLARVTKPGGLGFHQIDFRYHKSMDRPLDFLATPDDVFEREFRECHGECGNRLRPFEYARLFEAAGFRATAFSNLDVEAAYLHDFVPRLRAAARSKYRDTPVEELRTIGAMFQLVRDGA